MNYYERHLGDYARDTAHLSLLEHGVYTLLLDRYYATEQPIPADQAHRVARARSREEKAAVDAVLAEFFVKDTWHSENGQTGDVYRNRRADEEIAKLQAWLESQRVNGKKGGRPRKTPVSGNPNETQQKPMGFDLDNPNETQSKAHQTPDTKHQIGTVTSTPSGSSVQRAHGDGQGQVSQAAACAIALNRSGFRTTSQNPNLIAYADAGGTPEHLAEIAQHPDCAGKAAGYVIAFARRELADKARPVAAGPPRQAAPSKTLTGMQALLEETTHGQQLAQGRNPDRIGEAVEPPPRRLTSG